MKLTTLSTDKKKLALKFLFALLVALLVLSLKPRTVSAQEVAQMTCAKGSNPLAVQLYRKLADAVDSAAGTSLVLRIEDQDICAELQVKCPFETNAGDRTYFWPWYQRLGRNALNFWIAIKGQNQDGVAFMSQDAGMTLVKLNTGTSPSFDFNHNWFFNYGDCR